MNLLTHRYPLLEKITSVLLSLLAAALALAGLNIVLAHAAAGVVPEAAPLCGAAQGGFVLVTEMAANSVAKIDVSVDQVVGRAIVGDSPGGLAPDPLRRWVYVAVQQGNQIVAVQADTLLTASLPIPGLGLVPIGLDLTSDGGTLLVTTRGSDGVISADDRLDIVALNTSAWPPTAALVTSIPTGLHPINVAVSHDDQYAVVTVRNQPAILIIDLQTYAVVAQASDLPLNAEPEGLDFHPTQNIAYATLHGPISAVEVIDLDTLTFVTQVPIVYFPPAQPSTGAFTPDGLRFYISGQSVNKIFLFDTAAPLSPVQDMSVILASGPQPHFIAYLPGDRAYVANTNNTHPTGSLSIIENYSGSPSISGPILTDLGGPLRLAYFPALCHPVEAVAVSGPQALLAGESGVFTATYTPITATAPVTLTWDNGAQGITATYGWEEPGVYPLTATAVGPCGQPVSGAFTVTVCQPVEGLEIVGSTRLNVGESGLYTATYAPITATAPVTLTWDHSAIGPTAAYSWTLPGVYTITATAANPCGGPVGSTFTVTVCQPLETAAISGPVSLTVGESGQFTVTYAPLSATLPVTVSWDNGATGFSAVYSWTAPGTYTITATLSSPCSEVFATFLVQVSPASSPPLIYLPLVLNRPAP